jgi:hypothetical protein
MAPSSAVRKPRKGRPHKQFNKAKKNKQALPAAATAPPDEEEEIQSLRERIAEITPASGSQLIR